jgi:hypothetical protein
MAFNGTGSNVTSLNASNVASGTLAVARGGTGTASPSLVGGTNITISGSWPNQTVTASGGGVTSLNGETGAITNTDLFDIGSYAALLNGTETTLALGSTRAGSSLRYNFTADGTVNGNLQASLARYTTTVKGTAASGTWRKMDDGVIFNGVPQGLCENYYGCALYVRIS